MGRVGRVMVVVCALAGIGVSANLALASPTGGATGVGHGRAHDKGRGSAHAHRSKRHGQGGDHAATAAATSTSTTTSTTTTTTTTSTTPPQPVAQSFVQPTAADEVPPAGEATAFGCAAAAQYIAEYAAPGFSLQCPAYSGGHQATTSCVSTTSPCNLERVITIADPCAVAYMNEASNSWVLLGVSDAPLDPYGMCH